jgi:hypothetical protein
MSLSAHEQAESPTFTFRVSDTSAHAQLLEESDEQLNEGNSATEAGQNAEKEQQSKFPTLRDRQLKFYKIPESERLRYLLDRRDDHNVRAAVGFYNPHRLDWATKPETPKDNWHKEVPRFQNGKMDKKDAFLSPLKHRVSNLASCSFRSSQHRFKNNVSANPAPGSYDVYAI